MDELVDMNISETLDNIEGGFWFDFEEALVKKDAADPNMQSAGDLAGEPRGICKFFLKGSCSKQNNCQYRHTRAERSVVCKHWLRALCKKGDACEFLHEYNLAKMPECYFFSKFGECSNPECMYLHINPEDKIRECPWYARGFCKHGDKCRHRHVKKVACDNYMAGCCPEGPNCKFGHPKFELPTDDPEQGMRKTPVVCHKCGVLGHKASHCPTYKEERTGERPPIESVECYKCGHLGHYANKCPMGVFTSMTYVAPPNERGKVSTPEHHG